MQRCIKTAPALQIRRTWTIHDCTVVFQQPCLKALEKINDDIKFVWYVGWILRHKSCFKNVEKEKNDISWSLAD